MNSETIVGLVKQVTGPWARTRRAEERDASRAFRRRERLVRSQKVSIIDAAFAVMEDAYLAASDNGRLPAKARQIFYKARGPILDATGEDSLDSQYFTQNLLPRYLREYEGKTAEWNVVYDARGKLTEPHTGRVVPMGTQEVDRHLQAIIKHMEQGVGDASFDPPEVSSTFPTIGPRNRYGAILFCEKEGFNELFDHVRLAERYDIAPMSTKGMSVTAARHFIDRLQSICPIPVLVLHDMDKSGFSILATLQRATARYKFTNKVPLIDLGVRMDDVQAYKLEAEDVVYANLDPRVNLRQNGASREEVNLLCQERHGEKGWRGERVELNAFGSRELVDWIESKFRLHGVRKVVPGATTLTTAYRRAQAAKYTNEKLTELTREASKRADGLSVPNDLAQQIDDLLQANPTWSWDQAVAQLVAKSRAV